MRLHLIRPVIELAWGLDTTWSPETYEGKDPAWGQCGVTTIYVHFNGGFDMMDGTAVFPDGHNTRHFWNCTHDGVDIDLTARQFPIGTVIYDAKPIDLVDIAQGEWFFDRYKVFANRVKECLNTQSSQPRATTGNVGT